MLLGLFIDRARAEGHAQWEYVDQFLAENPNTSIHELLAAIADAGLKIVDETQIDIEIDAAEDVLDDPVRVYLRETCQVPPLTPDREQELALNMRTSEIAKKDLVEANLRIPVALAGHFSRPDVHILDLIMEGNYGLFEAANTFDPQGGYRFRPYAYWHVRKRVKI